MFIEDDSTGLKKKKTVLGKLAALKGASTVCIIACYKVWKLFLELYSPSLAYQLPTCKIQISALLTMPKPSTVWITINYGKF